MAVSTSKPGLRLPFYYTAALTRSLRAAVVVIRPRHDLFDHPVDDAVVATLLSFMPYMAALLRLGFAAGLGLLEYLPVFFGNGLTRFSSMQEAQALAYLQRWQNSIGPFAMFFESLRELVLLCFYQQPEILEALGVDWQGRAHELVERRARLQAMASELANPRNSADRRDLPGSTP